MHFIRLYTGSDGASHIESLDIQEHPEQAQLKSATGIAFRVSQPGHFWDWHPAPRRQYVITLQGEGEIGLEDGTRLRLRPGDVLLAEDVTGKGHTSRVVSDVPRILATVSLQ